jgi:hypothetical protein
VLDGLYSGSGSGAAESGSQLPGVAVIACGALSHELHYLRTTNGWDHLQLFCLDAGLHNRPDLIPGKLRAKIAECRGGFDNIFVAYADCGTAGAIDALLEEEGVERLGGAHCYSIYAGERRFEQLAQREPATFYLTDYLARHFQRLVIEGLKLDRYPQLRDDYFGNYRRVLYLSQRSDESLLQAAREAAESIGLEFEHLHCGYGELETGMRAQVIAFG